MTQLFQDTIAIYRHFHKLDLFFIMTANPKWPEIVQSLFPGQTATNHSDIVLQVFEQKKKVLLRLIDNSFFGTVVAHIYTIEFQKRGPLYARPDNGLVFECNGTRFTNQYMVSHCPQLLLLFDCHINVEVPAGLGTVKYLSKYIYESPDRATMEISNRIQDEIQAHLDGLFIGPTEACQKIFEFNIHGELPAIQCLPVHFPNEHYCQLSCTPDCQ